jgi:uncharacterized protein
LVHVADDRGERGVLEVGQDLRQQRACPVVRRLGEERVGHRVLHEVHDAAVLSTGQAHAKIAAVEDSFGVVAVTALFAGILFGYCAQRGGFCLTRALSNLVLAGDASIARAYVLALAIAVVGLHLLISIGDLTPTFGLDQTPVRPFRWAANVLGGLLFGIGMVLGGGCAGSTWYRVGEGALGAGIVLLGFALGATATGVGILAPLRRALQQPQFLVRGEPPTLPSLLGVGPWPVIAVVAVLAVLWLRRGSAEPEHGKWRWPVTGSAMGLVIALGWYLSSFAEAPTGITFAANTGEVLTYPLVGYPNRVRWGMLLLPGVVLGAAVAAWRTGQFGWKAPPGFTGVKLFLGGIIMGIGALIAEGCNITQGLTYGATLSLGSLVAFASMLLGGWVTLWALFLRR